MGVYADRFNVVASNLGENVRARVQNLIVDIGQRVVLETPIDTGKARRNWQPGINSAPVGTLDAPAGPNGGQQESILAIKAMARDWQLGQTFHITNNLPYISALNDGSSKQAPRLFVENAILAAVRQLNNTVFR